MCGGAGTPSWYVTSHSVELSLPPLAGREMSMTQVDALLLETVPLLTAFNNFHITHLY